MKEELLIKYFNDQCTAEEELQVLDWAAESPENMKLFVEFKNLWTSQNLPSHRASDADYHQFLNRLNSKKRTSRIEMLKYSIAASLLILLTLNLFSIYQGNRIKDYPQTLIGKTHLSTEQLKAEADSLGRNFLYTEKGVKGRVTLPDGSTVVLNSDSKIIYPTQFSEDSRVIEFSGEGYFEVVSDSLRPLIIHTNKNFRAEVYGTSFNIKSYDNDSFSEATLYSGALRFVTFVGKHTLILNLLPNETIVIPDNLAAIKEIEENPEICSAWKDGLLIFNATPLNEAIKMLERWHGTSFVIENDQLLNQLITASFTSESIVQIMELLHYSLNFDYSFNSEDNSITIK